MSRTPFHEKQSYPYLHAITTRWADNDVYGHVNNVTYYSWFDTAVNGWLIKQGQLDFEAGDVVGLVVETGCRYARPVAFPQPIEIGIAVAHIGNSSVRYELGVFADSDPDAVAEGHFVHVYVERISRRPTPLLPALRSALESIQRR